jgi:hypothetical protein
MPPPARRRNARQPSQPAQTKVVTGAETSTLTTRRSFRNAGDRPIIATLEIALPRRADPFARMGGAALGDQSVIVSNRGAWLIGRGKPPG